MKPAFTKNISIMNTVITNLEREYNKLNKEYIQLDKQNDNESLSYVLEANYNRMDEIQQRMSEIANQLENS